AVSRGARVINLSLTFQGHTSIVGKAISHAKDSGILVVGAAGNDGVHDVVYPADDSDVLAVTATDASGVKLPFANYGSDIALTAPGDDVLSAYDGADYARWDGTSMAAPFVSGAAARLIARYADLQPDDILQALEQSSTNT